MKLQLQNVGEATIVVKDDEGYSNFVAEVAKGETKSWVVNRDVVQRLAPKLKELEGESRTAEGVLVVGLRWSVLLDDTDEDRGVTEGLAGLPALNEFQAASYSTGGGAAGAVATGTGLLGNQVKAAKTIGNVAGSASIDFEAVTPGAPGNAVSVEFATPAGGGVVIGVVANKITITPAAGGSTTSAIATAVNSDADAQLLVQATENVAGTINEVIAEKWLEGGKGPGVSMTLGGTACSLTELTDIQATFDIPSGISGAGYIVPLEFRNGPHISRLAIPVVA